MIDLADKVRFLSDPGSYGGATRSVEVRETHMAWVFLADTRVYKMKKPVISVPRLQHLGETALLLRGGTQA